MKKGIWLEKTAFPKPCKLHARQVKPDIDSQVLLLIRTIKPRNINQYVDVKFAASLTSDYGLRAERIIIE